MNPNKFQLLGILVLLATSPLANAQRNGFEQPPIDYLNAPVHDPVAKLAAKIESGEAKLDYDDTFGYLKSVLKELDVPVSSQMLVFSKTSLQLHRISPRLPRALYFNDDVYVGFCQRGDVLEFASTDPKQGATFYTLKQSEEGAPQFVRDRGGCLTCHASNRTQNVPGYLVRSVFADGAGRPKLGSGTFTTDHTSKFHDRWGGWYVTGKHGSMRHMGNQICIDDEYKFDRDIGANKVDLSEHFRAESYLSPHSDIVALMVLEHQTQMHNAIAAANYETRQALHQSYQMNKLLDREPDHVSESAQRRITAAADNVLEYLLMSNEFQLTDAVTGSSGFAEEFRSRGKEDTQGRSLRDFDLETRLFRYPCSFLIHSAAFDALPPLMSDQIMTRLAAILAGDDDDEAFEHLTAEMRSEIRDVLLATKPEFKKYHLAATR
ncbi:hypothetical protein [Planctomycetes bacterium K23_9]|uniref:Cytochrome c domain-containing protein n=1 Tax=Stieleria marina TaxID=1930275 RepID=A0A517P1R4_9BACT|nr:hypothetical protein K239x_53300 [Planctomycetes bacterium K23_9]